MSEIYSNRRKDNKVVFELNDSLDLLAQKWLITELKHEPGIKTVEFLDDGQVNLLITYDPSAFSIPTLLDVVRSHYSCVKLRPNSSHEITA